MIIFLGLVIGIFSYYEYDCPLFHSYNNFGNGTCGIVEGCVDNEGWECMDECMFGYSWDGEGCSACNDEGAKTCGSDGLSTSCWDGFYLEGRDCIPCSVYDENCVSCNSNECTSCLDVHYLYSGECIGCTNSSFPGFDEMATDCTYSGTEITVTECYQGYTMTDFDSTYIWCVDCGDSTFNNFDFEATSCFAEGDNLTITECDYLNGYCLGDDGACHGSEDFNMDGPCTYDTTSFVYTATECQDGYGLCLNSSGDYGCFSCGIDNSDTCSFTDDTCQIVDDHVCVDEGVRYVDSGSGTCEDCGEHCAACEYDGGPICTACVATLDFETGYYIDENDVCQPCGSGCAECVNEGDCTTCVTSEGYGRVCFYEKTSEDGVMGIGEDDCPLGEHFQIVDGMCVSDRNSEFCAEADEDGNCYPDSCMYGYYYDETLRYCVPCDGDGMICDEEGTPIACFDGYFLNSMEDTAYCEWCLDRFDNCDVCNEYECFDCLDYYAEHKGMCFGCQDVDYEGSSLSASGCTFDGTSMTITGCSGIDPLLLDGECVDCEDASIVGYDPYATNCVEASTTPGTITVTECYTGYCLFQNGTEDTDWKCHDSHLNPLIEECEYNVDEDYFNATRCSIGAVPCSPSADPNTECYDCTVEDVNALSCTFNDECNTVLSVDSCQDGYLLHDNACYLCPSNCSVYFWNEDIGGCYCEICSQPEQPWERGYYSYSEGEECRLCGADCHECLDYDDCLECNSIETNEDCYDIRMCNGYYFYEMESCGEHGTCQAFEECGCDTDWYAEDGICNITTCGNYFSNHSRFVCSGYGECIDPDLCICESGHYGALCEVSYCHGIFSNETETVCSGHGVCEDNGTCTCDNDDGYFGERCNEIVIIIEEGEENNITIVPPPQGDEGEYEFEFQYMFDPTDPLVVEKLGKVIEDGDEFNCSDRFPNIHEIAADPTCTYKFGPPPEERRIEDDWIVVALIITENEPESSPVLTTGGVVFEVEIKMITSDEVYTIPIVGICYEVAVEGANCDKWYCNGIANNGTEGICNDWGNCTAPETCVCLGGYTGPYCEFPPADDDDDDDGPDVSSILLAVFVPLGVIVCLCVALGCCFLVNSVLIALGVLSGFVYMNRRPKKPEPEPEPEPEQEPTVPEVPEPEPEPEEVEKEEKKKEEEKVKKKEEEEEKEDEKKEVVEPKEEEKKKEEEEEEEEDEGEEDEEEKEEEKEKEKEGEKEVDRLFFKYLNFVKSKKFKANQARKRILLEKKKREEEAKKRILFEKEKPEEEGEGEVEILFKKEKPDEEKEEEEEEVEGEEGEVGGTEDAEAEKPEAEIKVKDEVKLEEEEEEEEDEGEEEEEKKEEEEGEEEEEKKEEEEEEKKKEEEKKMEEEKKKEEEKVDLEQVEALFNIMEDIKRE